jgi:hypothetical protein
MGRGRTTTGMVTACLISSTMNWQSNYFSDDELLDDEVTDEPMLEMYDAIDGPSEEEVYLAGN